MASALESPVSAEELIEESAAAIPAGKLGKLWAGFLNPALLSSMISSILVTGLNAVQGVLLFRILEDSGRGVHSAAINFSQTFLFISMLGVYVTLTQWSARAPQNNNQLRSLGVQAGVVSGLAGILAVSFMVWLWLPTDKRSLLILCGACTLALPFEHIRFNLLSVEQGAGRMFTYNLLRVLQAVVFPALVGLAWFANLRTPIVTALLWTITPIVALVPHVWIAPFSIFSQSTESPSLGQLFFQSRGFAASVMATDLFNRMDQFLAVKLLDFAALGLYASACPIAQLLLVIPNTFGVFAFNAGARRSGRVSLSQMTVQGAAVLIFQAISGAISWLAFPMLISLLYGPKSQGVTTFALALLPGFAAAGVGAVAECYLRGCDDVMPGIIGRCGGWILLVLLGWKAFALHGPQGLAYATSAVQALTGLWLCICFYRNVWKHNQSLKSKDGEVECPA